MVTNISSKSELNSLASKLVSQSTQLKSIADELKSVLSGVSNYEDIDMKGAGSILASNIANIAADMDVISHGIQGYIMDIEEFDKYDFNLEAESNKNKVVSNAGVGSPVVPSSSTTLSQSSASVSSNGYSSYSRPIYFSTQNSNVVSEINNSEVNNNKDIDKNVSVLDRPVVDNKEDNNIVSNNSNDIMSNKDNSNVTPNIQYTDNNNSNNNVSVNENVGIMDNNSFVDTPVTDISVDNTKIMDEQITNDVLDTDFSEDIYVNEQSGYIGGTNSNITSDDITSNESSNSGSVIPGIIGGLGAAAVVGVGAVGGAKVIKNMKKNQEIDDDE